MYNYKIDNDSTSKIVNVYEEKINNQKIDETINKIINLINKNNLNKILSRVNLSRNTFRCKNINIKRFDAFDETDINKFNQDDKEFSDVLNVINFRINSLNQQKQKAYADFNIADAVKLTNLISELQANLIDVNSKISEYNNKISDIEQDFNFEYDKFVTDIDNTENININDEFINKYNSRILGVYLINQITKIFDTVFKDLSKEEVLTVLDDGRIKDVLGLNHQRLTQDYIDYVGTNN